MMTYPALHPPIPYADHHFTFNPQLRLSNRYHDMDSSPPLGQSQSPGLFSARETDRLFSFLDEFDHNQANHNPWNVKLEPIEQTVDWHGINSVRQHHGMPLNVAPYSNPHLDLIPNSSTSRRKSFLMHSPSTSRARLSSRVYGVNQKPSQTSSLMTNTPSLQFAHLNISDMPLEATARRASSASLVPDLPLSGTKPLLSSPQKRLNHIMSEQKRRNAIRDGYAQLITLLAPEGSEHGLVMPTRGRPKGSGTKGRQGKGSEGEGAKGKSGVLFRAVEYCHWLEEGRNALKAEVERVEAAAGIFPS